MNNEQIEAFLVRLTPPPQPFKVIQTGKRSRKVNGLYKAETREILIHNRNFQSDLDLLRTAIHEYAHHLHHCSDNPPKPGRPHDRRFWALFHNLLQTAEERGLYVDVFRSDPEFATLTRQIKERLLEPHSRLFKELGSLLARAYELCRSRSLNFRDYVERELGLTQGTAWLSLTAHREDWPDTLSPDQMRVLHRFPRQERPQAASKLAQGLTTAQVLASNSPATISPSSENQSSQKERDLLRRKRRLEDTIARCQAELEKVEEELRRLQKEGEEIRND